MIEKKRKASRAKKSEKSVRSKNYRPMPGEEGQQKVGSNDNAVAVKIFVSLIGSWNELMAIINESRPAFLNYRTRGPSVLARYKKI